MTDGGAAPGADRVLEQAARARQEATALRERLEAATQHAEVTTLRVRETRDRLADESQDVERLESLSWSRILSTLRGARATDLERESAEREAARYLVADAEARDQVARRDVEGLQERLDDLGDVDAAYAEALKAKEQWAAEHDPDVARRLGEIAERRGALLAEDTEAREAHTAGLAARDLLLRARQLLGHAQSWSTWDTFGGGGLFTDLMKYDRLDEVAHVLRLADLALGAFSRELADLELGGVGGVQVDGLTRTFDVFFDNIFSDLQVRSRIQEAGRRVEHALQAVTHLLGELSERGRGYAEELAALDRSREDLLT